MAGLVVLLIRLIRGHVSYIEAETQHVTHTHDQHSSGSEVAGNPEHSFQTHTEGHVISPRL